MDNLFSISNELRNIIEDIEVQGGEVTDEQLQQFEVKEQEMKDKLDNYRKAILVLKYQEEMCSNEIKRLQAAKKTKGNIVDKLNNSILNAVLEFGDYGKSGNKTYSTDTFKFYTVNRKGLKVDEHRLQILAECFKNWATYLNDNDCLINDYDDFDFNPDNVINWINKHARENGFLQEEDPDFIVDDLYCVKIEFNASIEIANLIKRDKVEILQVSLDNDEAINSKPCLNPIKVKELIDSNIINPTVASIIVKPYINMR